MQLAALPLHKSHAGTRHMPQALTHLVAAQLLTEGCLLLQQLVVLPPQLSRQGKPGQEVKLQRPVPCQAGAGAAAVDGGQQRLS